MITIIVTTIATLVSKRIYDMRLYYIYVNCNWVVTRWQ